jgi:hypothetical protein
LGPRLSNPRQGLAQQRGSVGKTQRIRIDGKTQLSGHDFGDGHYENLRMA